MDYTQSEKDKLDIMERKAQLMAKRILNKLDTKPTVEQKKTALNISRGFVKFESNIVEKIDYEYDIIDIVGTLMEEGAINVAFSQFSFTEAEIATWVDYTDDDRFNMLIKPNISWLSNDVLCYLVDVWDNKTLKENRDKPATSYMSLDEIAKFYRERKAVIDEWKKGV